MTEQLKSQIQEESSGGFAGTLRNIQLSDIIQMCCLAGASLCVRVHQGRDQGAIYIQDGELVHAACGDTNGVEAFFTMIGWPGGKFETLDAPLVTKPTIREPYQFLLMEAARRADENAAAKPEPVVETSSKAPEGKIRVLIVDDSAIMSKILGSMLAADSGIEVVGNARNGEEALALMRQLAPDLITMDVNMPVMDGSTALKHIMIESPCPVLIMSNLGSSSYATILSFLNLGAVDFMSKPVKNRNIVLQQQRMVERVRSAVQAKVKRFQRLRLPRLTSSAFVRVDESAGCGKLVITVSGVGGYLEMVNTLTALPRKTSAGILSLQSIPPQFAPTLAEYLNARSPFDVQVLAPGARLCPGRCYIGTTGQLVELRQHANTWYVHEIGNNRQEEEGAALDALLIRTAAIYRDKLIVLLLSGSQVGASMSGLRAVHGVGGHILAPKLEKSILPSSIATVVSQGLVTELFDPKDVRNVLERYCP